MKGRCTPNSPGILQIQHGMLVLEQSVVSLTALTLKSRC